MAAASEAFLDPREHCPTSPARTELLNSIYLHNRKRLTKHDTQR